jgi:hypothetical protein
MGFPVLHADRAPGPAQQTVIVLGPVSLWIELQQHVACTAGVLRPVVLCLQVC